MGIEQGHETKLQWFKIYSEENEPFGVFFLERRCILSRRQAWYLMQDRFIITMGILITMGREWENIICCFPIKTRNASARILIPLCPSYKKEETWQPAERDNDSDQYWGCCQSSSFKGQRNKGYALSLSLSLSLSSWSLKEITFLIQGAWIAFVSLYTEN